MIQNIMMESFDPISGSKEPFDGRHVQMPRSYPLMEQNVR